MIASFDIETLTIENKLKPYCLCFYSKKNKKSFYGFQCIDEFLAHIFFLANQLKQKKRGKLVIFSHNLTFDGSLVLQNLSLKNISFKGLFFRGNIYFFEIKQNELSVIFKCSLKFFPLKLKIASEKFNIQPKLPFNHKEVTIANFEEKKDHVIEYCENDAIIVFKLISIYDSIFKEFSKNWIYLTHSISGVAIQIFFSHFNFCNLEINFKIDDDAVLRSSYFGGRCEIFGNPRKNELIYHYDFTGMYAQIMLESFNFGSLKFIKNPSTFEKNGFFFVEAFSISDIPVLPIRANDTQKLLFCAGYAKGLFWHEELEYFIQEGGKVLNWYYHIQFEKNDFIFKNFIKILTEKRKLNTKTNIIYKLIINSVYGRMGMSEILTETKLFLKNNYIKFQKKKNI